MNTNTATTCKACFTNTAHTTKTIGSFEFALCATCANAHSRGWLIYTPGRGWAKN